MLLYLKLAWRNIWRHRRRTIIVVSALGMGVMFMLIYDGMIAGFQDAIYGNAIKVLGGNLRVHAAGYAESTENYPILPLPNDLEVIAAAQALPEVSGAFRRINTGGLATNAEGAFAVGITAISPLAETLGGDVIYRVFIQIENLPEGAWRA